MILDTNILIDVLDGNGAIRKSLEQLKEKATTTVINKYELLKAPADSRARDLWALWICILSMSRLLRGLLKYSRN